MESVIVASVIRRIIGRMLRALVACVILNLLFGAQCSFWGILAAQLVIDIVLPQLPRVINKIRIITSLLRQTPSRRKVSHSP